MNRPRHIAKGRPNNKNAAKLTAEQRKQIRVMRSGGFTQAEVARKFRVTPAAISHIETGRCWSEEASHGMTQL